METVLKAIADWIKGILTVGIMSNLSGLFDDVNTQVGNIAQQVGTKPSSFEPRVFAMIEALSRNVVLPIAGIILTFIACYELIEMITQHNNMAQFEPALIMRWIFKTAISVWLISNTFDIVMAVFPKAVMPGSSRRKPRCRARKAPKPQNLLHESRLRHKMQAHPAPARAAPTGFHAGNSGKKSTKAITPPSVQAQRRRPQVARRHPMAHLLPGRAWNRRCRKAKPLSAPL